MFRFHSLLAAVTAGLLILAAHPAVAQPMPIGGSKLWPWNVNGYQGYNEPPHATKPANPTAPPVAPTRYRVAVTILAPTAPSDEYANRAMMVAHLPEEARIWFQDKEATTKGMMREFMSPPLAAGKNFVYTVRVEWVEGGIKVDQVQEFNVKPGAIHCIHLVRTDSTEGDIVTEENLGKLSTADRKLAEAQKFCVVQSEYRLGVMGKPVKIMVKGEPVFLCCDACVRKAMKDPDATLAKVRELKAKVAAEKP